MYKVKEGCPGCGVCVDLCPINAISFNGLGVKIIDNCIGCGICAPSCPVGLIVKAEVKANSNSTPEKGRRKLDAQTDTGI